MGSEKQAVVCNYTEENIYLMILTSREPHYSFDQKTCALRMFICEIPEWEVQLKYTL